MTAEHIRCRVETTVTMERCDDHVTTTIPASPLRAGVHNALVTMLGQPVAIRYYNNVERMMWSGVPEADYLSAYHLLLEYK